MANNISSIGVLDINYSSISVLDKLANDYPNEVIYYLNDFNGANFDEWSHKAILEKIKEDTNILLSYNPKLLVVLGNEYIEYAKEFFSELEVPVINLVDIIVDMLNQEYEKKNIALLIKSTIHQANLYQRNINYGHFYLIDDDDLEKIVINNKVKTGISFDVAKKVLADLARKSVDVIISANCNVGLLSVEAKESVPKSNLVNVSSLVSKKIEGCLDTNDSIRTNGKGKVNIIADKEFDLNIAKNLLDCKYYILPKYEIDNKKRGTK